MREERQASLGYLAVLALSIAAWIGLCLAIGATLRQCSEVEAASGKAVEQARRLEQIRRALEEPRAPITDFGRAKK